MFSHKNPTSNIREYIDETGNRIVILPRGINAGVVHDDGTIYWFLEGMDRVSDELLDEMGWVPPWARWSGPVMHSDFRNRG